MRKIFCLDTVNIRDFDNYQKVIAGLANDELTPGAKPEILKFEGITLWSVRETGADRLIYNKIKKGPDAGGIVLCGVCDGHDYTAILRRLKVRQTSKAYSDYHGPEDEEGAAAEDAEVIDESNYHEINPFRKYFIKFDEQQNNALSLKPPAILHGPPGSGKTLIIAEMLFRYACNPIIKDELPLGFIYLAPTTDLLVTARAHYADACQVYLDAGGELAPGTFATYADFFKNNTREGREIPEGKPTGFPDFQAWYKSKQYIKKKSSAVLSAEDCWTAFRICSLYTDVKDYMALGEDQCVISSDMREVIYDIFSQYKLSCDRDKIHSEWITPFTCEERHGLVVLDESQTQSGSTIASCFKMAEEFFAVVGDHQKIDMHASAYGRGINGADLLRVALHKENILFDRAYLPRTYRNSETVVELLNYIIKQKKLSGLHRLVKGTDGLLEGSNGDVGEASFVYETEPDKVLMLQQRFLGRTDVCVMTSADSLKRAREMWPGVAVLTPFQAMGLEFEHVVCLDLLGGHDETIQKACKVLHSKYGMHEQKAASLEPWFNNLITALSRAKKGVHIIEAKHQRQLGEMFGTFRKICDKNSTVLEETQQEPQALPVSSPEQWLAQATRYLNSNMAQEALRLMNANVLDRTCHSYITFMKKYDASLQENAFKPKPATKLLPAASKMKKTETPKINLDAKQPEIQEKLVEPVIAEPLITLKNLIQALQKRMK